MYVRTFFNVCHPEVFNTCMNIQLCISQTQQNLLTPYLAMFKMRCKIPNVYILEKTMYKMHVSLCYYYTIRTLISKTLTGTYEGVTRM